MNYRRRFEPRDFRWAGPEADGLRLLEYIGLPVKISIEMHRHDAIYAAGPVSEPAFRPADRDIFNRCGGIAALLHAAAWFANRR